MVLYIVTSHLWGGGRNVTSHLWGGESDSFTNALSVD